MMVSVGAGTVGTITGCIIDAALSPAAACPGLLLKPNGSFDWFPNSAEKLAKFSALQRFHSDMIDSVAQRSMTVVVGGAVY